MLPIFVNFIAPAAAALVAGGVVFAIWLANRKRLAAETVGRAEEQAQRITQDAQRDADKVRLGALVDEFLEVRAAYVDGNRRQLTFSPHGQRYEEIVEGLRLEGSKGKRLI